MLGDHEAIGKRIANILSRSKGISPAVIEFIGWEISARVITYKIRQADDGKSLLIDPDSLQKYDSILVEKACVPPNSAISIRTCHGYVAVEVTRQDWQPLFFKDEVDGFKGIVTPLNRLIIYLGRDSKGQEISINLSEPTGTHTSVSGINGSGKNAVLDVMIGGSLPIYPSWFVQFVLISSQRTDLRIYEKFHPWLWNADEVLEESIDIARLLTNEDDIARVLRYVPDVVNGEDKVREKRGLIFQEALRRADLFEKPDVVNLEQYNAVAYEHYLRWKAQHGIPDQQDPYEAYHETDPLLPILPRLVIVIDEIDATGDKWGKAKGQTFNFWIKKIASELRKYGIHLVCAAQRPSADAGGPYDPGTRAQFGNQIALKQTDEAAARMGLQGWDLALNLGGNGDAYILVPGVDIPIRIQVYYCERSFLSLLVAEVARVRPHKRPLKLRRIANKLPEKQQEAIGSTSLLALPEVDWKEEAWMKILEKRQANPRARESATGLAKTCFGETAFTGASTRIEGQKRKLVEILSLYEPTHPALQEEALADIYEQA